MAHPLFHRSGSRVLFVPAVDVLRVAAEVGAIPFDVPGARLGHHGKECSFGAILKEYGLTPQPALTLLGKIVNGADTDNSLWQRPEAEGLRAIAEGFRSMCLQDDHEIVARESIVYDALYAYCERRVGEESDDPLESRAPKGHGDSNPTSGTKSG